MVGRSAEDYRGLFSLCSAVMARLRRLPQPVIARVQGLATAAGCQLVAACDLAVAAETAAFATPGVKVGCSAPRRWSRWCGPSRRSRPWRCC
jgi:enoyl-CoA hydratase/carnithine racemase